MALQGLPVVLRKTIHAKRGDDVAVPRTPERHGIDQRLAQDDFFVCHQRRFIPHAAQGARQVQVLGMGGRYLVIGHNAPPVELQHLARMLRCRTTLQTQHRHHQAAIEVFVAGLAQHAQALQLATHRAPALGVARWQPVGQAFIGVAQLEVLHQFGMVQAALL